MSNPTKFSVELRDTNGRLVRVLTKKIKNLSWEYDRVGGCGRCSLGLAMGYDELENYGPDYDLQIWLEDSGGTAKLFFRGYAESQKPILQENDSIDLGFFGYVGQLKRVRVNHTYSNMEISAIIKDILDNYVLANTDITYNAADIETTSFTVDTLEFDTMADGAIKTLADLAGSIEWGVSREKKFFFKSTNNDIRHYLRVGKEVDSFDSLDDYSNICNRLYLKGGKVDGVTFEDTINNTESQAAYGLRSKISSNSAIVTSAVAQKYGTSVLAEEARVRRRVTISVLKNKKFFEETISLGALSLLIPPLSVAKKYNDADAIYGQFKYGGMPSFQIEKIRYTLSSEGTNVSINAGTARPDIAAQIKKLQYEIDQLRSG